MWDASLPSDFNITKNKFIVIVIFFSLLFFFTRLFCCVHMPTHGAYRLAHSCRHVYTLARTHGCVYLLHPTICFMWNHLFRLRERGSRDKQDV